MRYIVVAFIATVLLTVVVAAGTAIAVYTFSQALGLVE